MNNVEGKFLPLGTVVLLKDATKKLMITGFCTMDAENPGVMFDYSGCLYPEGVINTKQTALFNHDQIQQIYYMGYKSEEDAEFKVKLNSLLQMTNSANPMSTNSQTPPVANGFTVSQSDQN